MVVVGTRTVQPVAQLPLSLIGLPARRCPSCGGVRFVNVGGVPTCEPCGDFDPFATTERLVATIDGHQLVWQAAEEDQPRESEEDPHQTCGVYVSPSLEIRRVPRFDWFGDILAVFDRESGVRTKFRRLDRDLFRWLAARVDAMPPRDDTADIYAALWQVASAGVECGVLGNWALSMATWDLDRAPRDWSPFDVDEWIVHGEFFTPSLAGVSKLPCR